GRASPRSPAVRLSRSAGVAEPAARGSSAGSVRPAPFRDRRRGRVAQRERASACPAQTGAAGARRDAPPSRAVTLAAPMGGGVLPPSDRGSDRDGTADQAPPAGPARQHHHFRLDDHFRRGGGGPRVSRARAGAAAPARGAAGGAG